MLSNHTLNWLIALSATLAVAARLGPFDSAFMVLKPLTTCLIIALHFSYRQALNPGVFRLLLLALVFCLAGDAFLLEHDYFVFGLCAFLIAHVIFAWLFVRVGGWWFYPVPAAALLLIGCGFYYLLLPHLEALQVPVLIYQTLITLMAVCAIGVALKHRNTPAYLMAVAALLFVFSDSMIATNRFLYPFALSPLLVLPTYWLSITLLVNAFPAFAKQQ